MGKKQIPGLDEFLSSYIRMGLGPSVPGATILEGQFEFKAKYKDYPPIQGVYRLSISVPNAFPLELPEVKEIGGEISRTPENHVNDDGTLCLGSLLRLRQKLAKQPDLLGFAQLCLVPFLYGHWYQRKFRTLLPFGELQHGPNGEMADYRDLFGLQSNQQVKQVLQILSVPEKQAKRMPCPCGCGKRLQSCKFNEKLEHFRKQIGGRI